MDKRLSERIIILILLLLNLFLLVIVLTDGASRQKAARETESLLAALMEENGIRADRSAMTLREPLPAVTLVRAASEEAERVAAVLGASAPEDLGGNILFYRTESGQAVLRGSGELDILFSGTAVPLRGSPEKTALQIMKRFGMEAQALPAEESDGDRAMLCCCYEGSPVFNAVLNFDFTGEHLYLISGTRLFDRVTETRSEGLMDSAGALLRFLALVKEEGYICSELKSVSPGYLLSVTVSEEGVLTPVWRVETDVGVLFIQAETGKVVQQN